MAAAAINYLPEEVFFTILSWLPVLSLLRFKKVCKSWYKIISIPDFIKIHLANSHLRKPSLLRFAGLRYVGDIYIDSQEESIKLDLPEYSNDKCLHTRSCNGLVCFANLDCSVIHLFNPSTKWFKILPTPTIKSFIIDHNLGFGFDFVGNDYKLIRIVRKFDENNELKMYIEVYSANANSWKLIEVPKTIMQRSHPGINATCVQGKNGILYMSGMNKQLLSFDLHSEGLELYPYPEPVHHRQKSSILDFEGSVALIYYKPVNVEPVFSLWTLDDEGGKLFWRNKFNFEASWNIDRIQHYLGSGYFVAYNFEDGYFFYDYRKKKSKKFSILAIVEQVLSISKYTDTLVSLN